MLFDQLKRREFVAALGSVVAWPLAARAQQPPDRVRRIGVLNAFAESDPEVQANLAAFRQALQKLGRTEGRTSALTIAGATRSLRSSAPRQRSSWASTRM